MITREIVARNLRKSFPIGAGKFFGRPTGAVAAVDDVSFDIRRGETLGLVGESGCGKSTTGRVLMRLIEPDSGSIHFDGTDLTALGRTGLNVERKRLQLVFQDSSSAFNPRKRVGWIIAEPMRLAGMSRQDRRNRVAELLPLVGLRPEYGERFPHQFSGGQRQRIGIARALALQPELIVCDEPVSALDVSIQAQVVNLLKGLQDQFGLTYLFISHDLRVVRHLADRVAVMYLGRIVEIGTTDELYRHPRHPYTQMLLQAVPRISTDKPQHTTAVVGEAVLQTASLGCKFAPRCPRATATCRAEAPTLVSGSPGHSVACFYPN